MHANIDKKALRIFLQFSTLYLYEQGFATLVNIKTNKWIKCEFVKMKMREFLSTIWQRIKNSVK